ncbi:cytoplasmic dynein 2 intermediate chain 2-like [Spodoptera frugiperda]|uniref:Cytoplasmic dynein 2 intermediate chain 2-like n=1 Tax=Spodoptera frugiperda TaxID=7108 RepID=A0A9R0E5E4_SPOFR|nr:cytoplasmic dynein 2 intermediate chain 2-like [Spodoptera frugiperda]
MSNLSGYDGEAVGFDSVKLSKTEEKDSSTQTTEYGESGVSSQTNVSKDTGSLVTADELNAQDEVLKEYPPPLLTEFLKKVVPKMLEQLDHSDKDLLYNSSDSDEEEVLNAKLFQEIKLTDLPGMAGGDQSRCVLDMSWSSAGNSFAVSVGRLQHKNWCVEDGLIRIFTLKRTAGDTFVRTLDLTEKSCVTKLLYHPTVSALLAYGTTSGEVVLCNLRNLDAILLTSPAGVHDSKRVTALFWADPALANIFLTMHIMNTGKRRGASDQILISAGCDGTINVWRVNAGQKVFENVICYCLNGSRNMDSVNISCFDFIKTYPLRPSEEKIADDIFVVGSTSGTLYLCKIKTYQPIVDSKCVDPVYEVFQGHIGFVLDVAFSYQKPGVFVSASIDSEVRIYDVSQSSPLKVINIDKAISCMSWLPNNPCVIVLGLAKPDAQLLQVYNVNSGRRVPVEGLSGPGGCIVCIKINQTSVCRIAAADTSGSIRVWELPTRRIKITPGDLEF